jgi:hypothetical protein
VNGQCELYHATAKAPACQKDARSAPRYDAKESAVLLRWTEHEDFRTVPALLEDFSMGGALVASDCPPPLDATVLLRLVDSPCSEILEARVVGLGAPSKPRGAAVPRRRFLINLKFVEPCTYEFFKAVIDWMITEKPHPQRYDPNFDARDWR